METSQSPRAAVNVADAPKSNARRGQSAANTADSGSVRSVKRAFDLLERLDGSQPRATLTDFTNQTGLATTTVKRLLDTLEGEGILCRLPNGRYTHGSRLLQIAVAALHGVELYEVVERYMERLSASSGETVNFAILNDKGHVLYLRQHLSPRAIRHAGWLGRSFPAEGTAVGCALLGQVDDGGLASARKTLEPDVTAVAAPVHGPGGDIAGAISITGPTFRIDDDALAAFGGLIAVAACELSEEIGGQWPYRAAPADGEK